MTQGPYTYYKLPWNGSALPLTAIQLGSDLRDSIATRISSTHHNSGLIGKRCFNSRDKGGFRYIVYAEWIIPSLQKHKDLRNGCSL